ncbi:MAG: hypothetical protein ACLVI1_06270, partial [Subdoligranulum sp.]
MSMGKNRTLRYLGYACGNFMRFWRQKAPPLPPEAGYHFANTSLRGQFGKCEVIALLLLYLSQNTFYYK